MNHRDTETQREQRRGRETLEFRGKFALLSPLFLSSLCLCGSVLPSAQKPRGCNPWACGGNRQLPQANPAIVGRHEPMAVHAEALAAQSRTYLAREQRVEKDAA